MKTLYPQQVAARDFIIEGLTNIGGVLNASETGTGKTVTAVAVAADMCCPVCVIAPKATLPAWQREMEDWGVEPLFIANIEKVRRGMTGLLAKHGKRGYKWNVPKDTLVIFDECHRGTSGLWTASTAMMTAAVGAGLRILNMSATASDDVTRMRYLGYALRLHSLNASRFPLKSFNGWLRDLGCKEDPWGRYYLPRDRTKIAELRNLMFADRVCKIRVSDMPEAFKENLIVTEPLDFGAAVKKAYDSAGLDTDMITNYILTGETPPAEHFLTEMLYARMLAEQAKASVILDMVADLRAEGKSIVVFLNFRESASLVYDRLADILPDERFSLILGGQNADDREENIHNFQHNRTRVMVATSSAGGTGVNLHDEHGGHPRVTIISPDWSVKVYRQVLGRTHRAGMETPVVQKILVASGTVEEAVLEALHTKEENLDELFD